MRRLNVRTSRRIIGSATSDLAVFAVGLILAAHPIHMSQRSWRVHLLDWRAVIGCSAIATFWSGFSWITFVLAGTGAATILHLRALGILGSALILIALILHISKGSQMSKSS